MNAITVRHARRFPFLALAALWLAPAGALATHSEPTFVVVSGRQAVSGDESVCFKLDRHDAESDRLRVRIRFRGDAPRGYLTLDGTQGPWFTDDREEYAFRVDPHGVHRLGLVLREAATVDWLSITSVTANIEQVPCSSYEFDQARRVDMDVEPGPAVDRLERGGRHEHDDWRRDEPAPEPAYRHDADIAYGATIPRGTELDLVLENRVSTDTHRVGQQVTTRLDRDVVVDGRVVLPAGTRVVGTVAQGQKAGRFGRSRLRLDFGRAILRDGTEVPLSARVERVGQGSAGKQAGIIAGSAVGGAVAGKVIGGDSDDALLGAIVGAGIAAGSIAAKPGEPVVLPAGTLLTVQLDSTARIPASRTASSRQWRY